MAVIGIDLGTTYCSAAIVVDGKPQTIYLAGEMNMPSVVGLQKNGNVAVGKVAKANQARDPRNTIVEVKRLMGEDVTLALGKEQRSPQEISAMFLRSIKELAEAELGEPVTGAVIACPAHFKDPQRAATEEAGRIAGLKVLKIINEPTAAAYAYGVCQDGSPGEKLFIVYDLGGGTFDVTVIRVIGGGLEVIGTGGDPHLGGGDFDDRIVNWMMHHLRARNPEYVSMLTEEKAANLRMKLKCVAEAGKIELCRSPDANDRYTFQIPVVDVFQGKPISFSETLTMAQFEELNRELLMNSSQWIDAAMQVPREKYGLTERDVTAVLLVGGSTLVPMVRRLLEERFGRDRVRGRECGINPGEIVALGAALVAADEDPNAEETRKLTLLDVTGYTLSIATFDARTGRQVLQPIIPKETPIPCRGSVEFVAAGHQEKYQIRVFQGEGTEIDSNKLTPIGEFEIVLPLSSAPTPIKFELALDADGILIARATECATWKDAVCKLEYKDGASMSPESLKQQRTGLEAALNAENPLGDDRAGGTGKRASPSVPTARIDRVHFAADFPPAVQPGQPFLVNVWAHTERQRVEVERRIQLTSPQSSPPPVIQLKGPFKIERGTMLFVRLRLNDVEVDPAEDVILWEGEIGNASFGVVFPAEVEEGLKLGWVTVHWEGGLQIARIPLQIRLAAKTVPAAPVSRPMQLIRRAFASYASADRNEVLGRIQGMQKVAPDLNVFLDVASLRSGEDWEQKLWQVIPESDVFYLFWSAAASASPWVEKEWKCALKSRGAEFIDPVPLVSPEEVRPPEELRKKHFNDWILAYKRAALGTK
jgi:molecular chaperone DnaK